MVIINYLITWPNNQWPRFRSLLLIFFWFGKIKKRHISSPVMKMSIAIFFWNGTWDCFCDERSFIQKSKCVNHRQILVISHGKKCTHSMTHFNKIPYLSLSLWALDRIPSDIWGPYIFIIKFLPGFGCIYLNIIRPWQSFHFWLNVVKEWKEDQIFPFLKINAIPTKWIDNLRHCSWSESSSFSLTEL
jgi:hypothetical protein